MPQQPIDHPSAWYGSTLTKDALAFDLERRHQDSLRKALAHAQQTGKPLAAIRQEDFPLNAIATDLQRLRDEILHGRGIRILRGLSVEDFSEDELALLFWGLGTHLGHAVSQSPEGDRLGRVVDTSGNDPEARGYRSSKPLDFHTDSDNVVAMLCLRQARVGGLSHFASALTVHNELLAQDPHLLEILYRGFPFHWCGEEAPGEAPVTPYRIPIFSLRDGQPSCVLLRRHIEKAAEALDDPLQDDERAALDAVEEIAARDDVCLSLRLEPGEGFLINNFTVLHARSDFEDWPEPERRRLLLRLWLKDAAARPVVDEVRRFYGQDGIAIRQ